MIVYNIIPLPEGEPVGHQRQPNRGGTKEREVPRRALQKVGGEVPRLLVKSFVAVKNRSFSASPYRQNPSSPHPPLPEAGRSRHWQERRSPSQWETLSGESPHFYAAQKAS